MMGTVSSNVIITVRVIYGHSDIFNKEGVQLLCILAVYRGYSNYVF